MNYLSGSISYQNIKDYLEDFGSPLHIYSTETISKIASSYKEIAANYYPDMDICFASKSNPCMGAIKVASENGLGCDAVSEFELKAALSSGISPDKIYCNGNAKDDNYLRLAVSSEANIVLDNEEELDSVESICSEFNKSCNVLVRFSNIDGLDGLTSKAQSTATHWTKFGFSFTKRFELVELIEKSSFLNYMGPSAHIGTQLTSPKGFTNLLEQFIAFSEELLVKGINTRKINIGGGFPVNFFNEKEWQEFKSRLRKQRNNPEDTSGYITWDNLELGYSHIEDLDNLNENTPWIGKAFWSKYPGAEMLKKILQATVMDKPNFVKRLEMLGKPKLVIEPGRSLFAPAGITATIVNNVKTVQGNNVVSVEMGIVNHGTNLISTDIFTMSIEPALNDDVASEAFIAGQLCFSSDMISKNKVKLNRIPQKGDILIIHNTGAYSADHFASNSCGFPRPAKIAISPDGETIVWRKREAYKDIFSEK